MFVKKSRFPNWIFNPKREVFLKFRLMENPVRQLLRAVSAPYFSYVFFNIFLYYNISDGDPSVPAPAIQ